MAGTSSHPDSDPQHPDGDSPTYHPPAYLARQAAQSRPLSPYHSAGTPGQRWAGYGCAVVLVLLLIAACSVGVNAAGGYMASVSATPTATQSTGDNSSQQGLVTSTDTPLPTPTDSPTPKPKPTATPTRVPPTATPIPQPTCIPGAVNCNPWGYNFSCCNYIFNPPSNFCAYFNCIPSFWSSTNGYVEECQDGMYSHSGGRSGSCSYHGGNLRPLFQR